MSLAEKLTEIYLNEETWHRVKLDKDEANRYHQALLDRGNIITVEDKDKLVGYVEFWRLTYEQFGRVICNEPFSAFNEDVQTGHIAYVANTYIDPAYRNGETAKMMRNRFLMVNNKCTHFVGEARRKSCAPVKVFKRFQERN